MIFISYPQSEYELATKLKSEFKALGVDSWVYSEDKKLAEDSWLDIEKTILESDQIVYIINESTPRNDGQIRELKLIKKWNKPVIPGWVGDTKRSVLPELETINGERLGQGYAVRRFAWQLYTQLYPTPSMRWRTPKPGDFLRVIKLDGLELHKIKLNDLLYFRQISPMGLFECFHVEGDSLFWVDPDNVEFAGYGFDIPSVPRKYQYESIIEAQRQWWGKVSTAGGENQC